MSDKAQQNINKQIKKKYYKPITNPTDETLDSAGLIGVSTSRIEYQEDFNEISEVSKILRFKNTYFMTPGLVDIFNIVAHTPDISEKEKFSLYVKLASSIYDPKLLLEGDKQQTSTVSQIIETALNNDEMWLNRYQKTIEEKKLIMLSGSIYHFIKLPDLFERFPLQKNYLQQFLTNYPNLRRDRLSGNNNFFKNFHKSANVIFAKFYDSIDGTEKLFPTKSGTFHEKAEKFIHLIIRCITFENGNASLTHESYKNKFRLGICNGALAFLSRKRLDYIKDKKLELTQDTSANLSSEQLKKIETEANAIYHNPFYFVSSVFYLLVEQIHFYHYLKKLYLDHYLYLGNFDNLPADKAFKKRIIDNDPLTQGSFKQIGLQQTTFENFEQFKGDIEFLISGMNNKLFPSSSYPSARPQHYQASALKSRQHKNNNHDFRKPSSSTTDDAETVIVNKQVYLAMAKGAFHKLFDDIEQSDSAAIDVEAIQESYLRLHTSSRQGSPRPSQNGMFSRKSSLGYESSSSLPISHQEATLDFTQQTVNLSPQKSGDNYQQMSDEELEAAVVKDASWCSSCNIL